VLGEQQPGTTADALQTHLAAKSNHKRSGHVETETEKGGAVSVPISVSFCSVLLTPGFHPSYDYLEHELVREERCGYRSRCKGRVASLYPLLLSQHIAAFLLS